MAGQRQTWLDNVGQRQTWLDNGRQKQKEKDAMKTGTEQNLKYEHLKSILGIPKYQITGILESLWQMACKSAPLGNIGKHSNSLISIGMEWDDDPDKLINALIESGWLEPVDDANRLIIHDWEDHAPEYIKKRIRRQTTADNGRQNRTRLDNVGQCLTTADKTGHDWTVSANGTIAKPSQAKPSQVKKERKGEKKIFPTSHFKSLMESWNQLPSGVKKIRKLDSKSLRACCDLVEREPELREILEDIPALMAAIRAQPGIHSVGWFNFLWLFQKKSKITPFNIQKILDKNYLDFGDDFGNGKPSQNRDPSRVDSGRPLPDHMSHLKG